MEFKKHQLAGLEGNEISGGRRAPKIDLLDVGARSMELIPLIVGDRNKDAHVFLRRSV
jgi:hypothetical protein